MVRRDSAGHGVGVSYGRPLTVVYVLERFPADTLNFVYNEIDVLENQGVAVEVFSLLPSIFCPAAAEKYLKRTRAVKPVPWHSLLGALGYYLLRRPLQLLSLLLRLPLDNRSGFYGKWPRSMSHVFFGVYFAYLLRDRKDHIHAHFAHKAATAALCAARLNGVTFSFTAHGSATIHAPSRYGLRSKIREALFVVAISEYNRRVILDLCPDVSPSKIVVNRTGIRLEDFPFRPGRKEPNDILRVLAIASLYPIKNHEGMLDAFGLLALKGIPFHLELIGKDDGNRQPELEARAHKLGIAGQIEFCGVADHSKIADRLQQADLFILTSHSEGIPVSMMEAMASGTPVLGPRVTGVPELVDEGRVGWLADPACPEEFAAVLERVFTQDGLLDSVRKPARRKIVEEYDMVTNAKSLAHILSEQLSRVS